MSHQGRQTAAENGDAEQLKPSAASQTLADKVSGARQVLVLHAATLQQLIGGRPLEALVCCQQALAIDPDNPETMNLIAIVYTEAKQFDHAAEWASRAIRTTPKPAYLTTLGVVLSKLRRHDDALKAFDKASQLKPDDPEPWWHMGNVLIETGRPSEALLCLEHTLKLNPQHGEAAYQAGHVLHGLQRFEEALAYLDRSAELRPDHALTPCMRAVVLMRLDRLDEALADNQRALELDPANTDIHNGMGATLEAMGRIEEALSWYGRALKLQPNSARALGKIGGALVQLGSFDEAAAVYERAVAIDPKDRDVVWNRTVLQLLTGDFEAGWEGFEALRWHLGDLISTYPRFAAPRWLGREAIAGKTLLVCQYEGLGDAIQFARYLPLLASRGARVILVVDPPLCSLLSKVSGVSQCLPKLPETRLPHFDFHVAIDSLPQIFGTRLDNIPAPKSYLSAPDAEVQAWEDRLGPREKPRVGLVWSGNPTHKNDRTRSIPLRMLSGLLDADATFVSLQKQTRPRDVAALRERPDIVDFTADLTDMAATAGLVSCLDLVIAVDTSVAHLAAALGRPTWIMLSQIPDFRWLLNRDDSPWYPTVRLFRQSASREYGSVLERVCDELAALVQKRNPHG
jgi:tetratricopeptide (TPR) repeat protein